MNQPQFLVLVILSVLAIVPGNCENVTLSSENSYPGCELLLANLSLQITIFVSCSLINAVPVMYCSSCIQSYTLMRSAYQNLTNGSDQNVTCQSLYFNKDRLNIIQRNYDNSMNIWSDGFCDNCYDSSGELSNKTKEFNEEFAALNDCYKGHLDPCTNCFQDYDTVNKLYDSYKEEQKDAICFDLQDKMNRTRDYWSNKLKCFVDEDHSQLTFLILSAIFTALPISFYVTMVAYTKNSERLFEHETLIIGDSPTTRVSAISPSIQS